MWDRLAIVCGSVGRTVASDNRDRQFESHPTIVLINLGFFRPMILGTCFKLKKKCHRVCMSLWGKTSNVHFQERNRTWALMLMACATSPSNRARSCHDNFSFKDGSCVLSCHEGFVYFLKLNFFIFQNFKLYKILKIISN